MATYLFSEEELAHLRYIREHAPVSIWYEYTRYIFDYENFHFVLDIEVADKINFSKKDNKFTQHALKTEVAFFDEKFVPRTGSDLLIENDSILEIDIARTKLYFTEHIKVSETYFHANSGQINPTKPIPEDIRQAKVVVVDAGVVIKCKSKIILNLFIADNEDDFITTNYYYRQGDFSKELSSKFQFIPII